MLGVALTRQMPARVVLAQVGLRVCLVVGSHDAARRGIALEAWAGATGRRDGGARLRAAVVTRCVVGSGMHLLGELRSLGGLAELVQVLADGGVPRDALAYDMMALGLVVGPLMAVRGRLRQMRLRRRLSSHGGRPLGPRMSIVGRGHAYVWAAAARCLAAGVWAAWLRAV